jgi:hypothetical protein
MIINGQAEMTATLSEEAQRQLNLRHNLAVETAKRYADAGFTVVYQDIVIGPALSRVVAAFQPYSLAVVVLCPRPEVTAARDEARTKTGYPDREAVDVFDAFLRSETPRIGYWLDNSDLSLEETVDILMNHLPEAAVPSKTPARP